MAGKPDTRELAHGGFVTAAVNAIIRILRHGTRKGPPAIASRLSRRHTPVVAIGCVTTLALMLGLPLTYAYGGARTFGYLAGGAGLSVVLIYLAVNVSAIHAFRTGFRDDFRSCRLLVDRRRSLFPVVSPLGILHPRGRTLMDLLPFAALGWLCLGVIAASALRARRPAGLEPLGRVSLPADNDL